MAMAFSMSPNVETPVERIVCMGCSPACFCFFLYSARALSMGKWFNSGDAIFTASGDKLSSSSRLLRPNGEQMNFTLSEWA